MRGNRLQDGSGGTPQSRRKRMELLPEPPRGGERQAAPLRAMVAFFAWNDSEVLPPCVTRAAL
jgi:hypothetical protein